MNIIETFSHRILMNHVIYYDFRQVPAPETKVP